MLGNSPSVEIQASVDLPTPLGPTKIGLVASLRKSRDINASMAARSQRFGQLQSKSQIGLKRPIWAALRRRSKLRRDRSCSSQSRSAGTQSAAATSDQWAKRPCRLSALARPCKASRLFVGFIGQFLHLVVELVIGSELMGSYRHITGHDMVGQNDGDGRDLLTQLAPMLERQSHGVRVRHVTVERLDDGRLQIAGSVTLQKSHQGGCNSSEIVAALGGAGQQCQTGRHRLSETISGTMPAGSVLVFDQGPDMGDVLDLQSFVVTAAMARENLRAIDDPHLVGIGQ